MIDEVFGHISYDDDDSWSGTFPLEFGGTWHNLYLLVQVDEDITDVQRQALQCFDDKWEAIEPLLVEALIKYYNQEEKYSYGPDNEEQAAPWWPDINTYEELINAVTPETIVILPDYLMETGRRIYLLFDRTWGGEDLDDNGIGVCFINEKIAKIGYKEIAF